MAILLLQGPMGPFFKRLMTSLQHQGADVYKINFNGGDEWYCSGKNVYRFSGSSEQWPDFLAQFITEHAISSVLVYGDCRLYHRLAKGVCEQQGVNFYAFEEGYIRPNHITFEKNGVNGYSNIAKDGLASWENTDIEPEERIGGHLSNRIRYCSMYYNVAFFRRKHFPQYTHHRSFSPVFEARSWLRASRRYYWYKLTEFNVQKTLVKQYSGRYFLVPLQVYNDAQIRFHSPYDSIEAFMDTLMSSFATHADQNDILVFKHHPMDRGHTQYADAIRKMSRRYGLKNRVMYCHDQHLPTLLDHAKGVLTINSTTALSAFYHKASVKVLGEAFYDIAGLCSQQSLDEFWRAPAEIDYALFLRLRNFLSHHGQVNGSYYKAIDFSVGNIVAEMTRNGALPPVIEGKAVSVNSG